jgi:hypothetical protein
MALTSASLSNDSAEDVEERDTGGEVGDSGGVPLTFSSFSSSRMEVGGRGAGRGGGRGGGSGGEGEEGDGDPEDSVKSSGMDEGELTVSGFRECRKEEKRCRILVSRRFLKLSEFPPRYLRRT